MNNNNQDSQPDMSAPDLSRADDSFQHSGVESRPGSLTAADARKKQAFKNNLIMSGVIGAVLLGAGASGYFVFLKPSQPPAPVAQNIQPVEPEAEITAPVQDISQQNEEETEILPTELSLTPLVSDEGVPVLEVLPPVVPSGFPDPNAVLPDGLPEVMPLVSTEATHGAVPGLIEEAVILPVVEQQPSVVPGNITPDVITPDVITPDVITPDNITSDNIISSNITPEHLVEPIKKGEVVVVPGSELPHSIHSPSQNLMQQVHEAFIPVVLRVESLEKRMEAIDKRLKEIESKKNQTNQNSTQRPVVEQKPLAVVLPRKQEQTTVRRTQNNPAESVVRNSIQVIEENQSGARVETPKQKAERGPASAPFDPCRVQAILSGRIWLKNENGQFLTLSPGDTLPSGDVIQEIDTKKGVRVNNRWVMCEK